MHPPSHPKNALSELLAKADRGKREVASSGNPDSTIAKKARAAVEAAWDKAEENLRKEKRVFGHATLQ